MKLQRVIHLPLALLAAGVLLPALALDARIGAAPAAPAVPPASGPGQLQVLYPPDGAVVTSSPALVMILGPDVVVPPAFQLDGAALDLKKMTFAEAWKDLPAKIAMPAGSDGLPLRSPLLEDKAGKALWMSAEDLDEGRHAITVDGAPLATFSSRAPQETDTRTWEEHVLRIHGSPGSREAALDCGQCHQPPSPTVLGLAPLPEACHTCHDDVDLSVSHEHVMEFLAKCQMCHDPHASTRPSLLIDRREEVCAQCHESGYAR